MSPRSWYSEQSNPILAIRIFNISFLERLYFAHTLRLFCFETNESRTLSAFPETLSWDGAPLFRIAFEFAFSEFSMITNCSDSIDS